MYNTKKQNLDIIKEQNEIRLKNIKKKKKDYKKDYFQSYKIMIKKTKIEI